MVIIVSRSLVAPPTNIKRQYIGVYSSGNRPSIYKKPDGTAGQSQGSWVRKFNRDGGQSFQLYSILFIQRMTC